MCIYYNCLVKFRSGYFSLRDDTRPYRSVEVDNYQIKSIIDADHQSIATEISEKLHISLTCIEYRLKQFSNEKPALLNTYTMH